MTYPIWLIVLFIPLGLFYAFGEKIFDTFLPIWRCYVKIELKEITIIFYVIWGVLSPIYWEFTPLFSDVCQYKIIRNNDGSIANLKSDATGSHTPFSSGRDFVTLQRIPVSWEDSFKYRLSDGTLLSFRYVGYGVQMKMAYIDSEGAQSHTDSVINVLDRDFMQNLKVSSLEAEKFKTAKEAYDCAVKVANQWLVYGGRIDISPDITRESEPQTFF